MPVLGFVLQSECLMRTLPILFCLLLFPHILSGQERTNPPLELLIHAGHSASLTSVAISPDGQLVATGSQDGSVILWDTKTGTQLKTLWGHKSAVTCELFSENGEILVTGSKDNTAILWDVKTGQHIRILKGHSLSIESLAISPEGQFLVTGSQDFRSILWDLKTGKEIQSFEAHSAAITDVVLSPDAKYVVTRSNDKKTILWETDTQKQLYSFSSISRVAACIDLESKSETLAIGYYDGTIDLWNLKTMQKTKTFSHAGLQRVREVFFRNDGKYLITGGWNGSVILWNSNDGEILREFNGPYHQFDLSDDGKILATINDKQQTLLLDTGTGKQIQQLSNHLTPVYDFAWSDNQKVFAVGFRDDQVAVWDMIKGQPVRSLTAVDPEETSIRIRVDLSADGQTLATSCPYEEACVWDTNSGKKLHSFPGHPKAYNPQIAISSDAQTLAYSTGSWVGLWDTTTGKHEIWLRPKVFQGNSRSIVFSGDSQFLASGFVNTTAVLWDANTGDELQLFQGHEDMVHSVSLNDDGKLLATGSEDHTAIVWDTTTGKQRHKFEAHTDAVTDVELNANGKILVTSSRDGTVKLWSTITGKELRHFGGFHRELPGIFLSKDGRHLVTGTKFGTIKFWNVRSGSELCHMICFNKGREWFVITPDGLFDGSPGAMQYVSYRQPETNKLIPLKKYQEKYFNSGLLPLVLEGKAPKVDLPANQFIPEE